MIKNNKIKFIISSVIILLPIVIGLVFWSSLPDKMAIHFAMDNTPDGFASKGMTVFGLPLFMLALHWIGIFATSFDKKNKDQNPKILSMILFLCPALSLMTAILTYSHAFGKNPNVGMIVMLFLGILFIIIGNYLPKCKPNHTIGIRLFTTLNDDKIWFKIHRIGGTSFMIGGIMIAVSAFLPINIMPFTSIGAIAIIILVPTIYSIILYRKK